MKKAWIPTTLCSFLGLALAAGLLWGCQDYLNNSEKSAAPGKPDTTSELVGKTAALLPHRPGADPKTHCAAFYEHVNGRGGTFFVSPGSSKYLGPAWNDQISSMTVARGCAITLYVDANHRGEHQTYPGPQGFERQNQAFYSTFGTKRNGYGDTWSSYTCDCTGMATGNNAGTVWDVGPGEGNARKILWYGPNTTESMFYLNYNDRAGYVVVNPGFKIKLWEHVKQLPGFRFEGFGANRIMTASDRLLGLSNKVSAAIAERLTVRCEEDHGCYSAPHCYGNTYLFATGTARECRDRGGESWCPPSLDGGSTICQSWQRDEL